MEINIVVSFFSACDFDSIHGEQHEWRSVTVPFFLDYFTISDPLRNVFEN